MQFEKGQKVRITGNTNEHEFEIGQIVEITYIDRSDDIHECVCEDGVTWWVREDEMEHVDNLRGSLARIIRNNECRGFHVGEIVKVNAYDPDIKLWKCYHKDGSDWWLVKESDMEKVG